jgi:hypothetical protein
MFLDGCNIAIAPTCPQTPPFYKPVIPSMPCFCKLPKSIATLAPLHPEGSAA